MKKIALIITLGALAIAGLNNCGPNQAELDRQKKYDDSINALDSDSTADNADAMIKEMNRKDDSIKQVKKDSADLAAKK